MKKTVRIRRARREDFGDIYEMDEKCFPHDSRLNLIVPGQTWWIAEIGKTPVGYAGAVFVVEDSVTSLCFHRAGVLHKHRGKGIQGRLIEKRIAFAKSMKIPQVTTYVAPYNLPSANNFIRRGFELFSPTHWCGIDNPVEITGGEFLYFRRRASTRG